MPIVPFFDPATGASGGPPSGGGTAPGAVWLEIPTTIVNATNVPSPVPASVQWPAPTNGTAPYTYEVTWLTDASTNFADYDLSTRTFYYSQGINAGSDNTKNGFIRIKATDSVGNYGYGYILIFRSDLASGNVFILPEIVLNETTTAPTYTFAPVVAGAVGRKNTVNTWSHVYGNGKISENPMYLADTTAGGGTGISRYMGPFVVDPVAGSVVVLTTSQESASGLVQYVVVQPFRRRRANSYGVGGPYMTMMDYNLQTMGAADPSAYTLPLSTGAQNHQVDFAPAPGETDFFNLRAAAVTAGSPATVEVCSFDANGQTLELQSGATANSRSIRSLVEMVAWPVRNNTAARRPNRVYSAYNDCEFVWRWHGRIEIGTNGGRVDWVNGLAGNGTGGGIAFFIVQTGGPAGTTTNTLVQVRGYRQAGTVFLGYVPAAEVLSRDIGVDIIGSGAQRVTYIYQWTGAFPDLTADRPYDGLKYWVIEGDGEPSGTTSFTMGASLLPLSGSSGYNGYAADLPGFYQFVNLNANTNARVFSRIYRCVLLARPRPIQRNFR